jgi:hypothetical protein
MSIIYINVVICSSFQRVVKMSISKQMDHMLEPGKIDNQVFVVLKLYLKSPIFEHSVEWFGKPGFRIYVFFLRFSTQI